MTKPHNKITKTYRINFFKQKQKVIELRKHDIIKIKIQTI